MTESAERTDHDDSTAPSGPSDDHEDGGAGPGSRGRVLARVGRVAAVLVLIVLALGFWPVANDDVGTQPNPATSYADAIERVERLIAAETNVFEPCRSRLLDHRAPTEVVVVLFHGLTNCPRQYLEMGEAIHDAGATVLITRAPGHGIANADGSALAGAGALRALTAGGLADWADEAIDIAAGLGDEVRVSGLSMGGVVSLWAAQHRPDVERVVAIAPAFELPVGPNFVSTFFTNLFTRLPTFTLSHERHIDHDYAAESTNGLAATFALGQAVANRGLDGPAAVTDLTVMLNPDDPLVSEDSVVALLDAWRAAGSEVSTVEFDPIGLRHDLIDIGQPNADPDHVYPLVLERLGFPGGWPTAAP